MICIFIAVAILLVYITVEIIKYKQIPQSISNTFYLGGKYWFTAVLSVFAFLVMAGTFTIYTGTFQFLVFLIGAGLLFVAAAPQFKEELEGKVHIGGAVVACVSSQAFAMICCSPWLALPWLLFPIYMKKRTRTFWAEVTCLVTYLASIVLIA